MFQETLIIGQVSDAGKLQYTPDGQAYILFTVQTIRRYTDFDTRIKTETVNWRVSAWDSWAEWAGKNLKVGMYLQVRGRLSPDEKTGGPRVRLLTRTSQYVAAFELVAREMLPWGGVPKKIEKMPLEQDYE